MRWQEYVSIKSVYKKILAMAVTRDFLLNISQLFPKFAPLSWCIFSRSFLTTDWKNKNYKSIIVVVVAATKPRQLPQF